MSSANKNKKSANKKCNVYLLGIASLAVVILAVILFTQPGAKNPQPSTAASNASVPAAQNSTAQQALGGELVISIADISEKATYYPMEVDGTKIEVLAVKAPDGTIRTAFNTCQVCYDSGRGYYVQEGSVLVCQNCGNRFRMSDVEKVKGGCNPVPITAEDKTQDETNITISEEFLQKAKVIFANWKN